MLDHVLDEARSPVKKDMLVNATVLDGFVLSDDIHVASAMYKRGTNGASCTALLRPALEGCGRIKWNAACVPVRVQGCRAVAVLREASRSLNLIFILFSRSLYSKNEGLWDKSSHVADGGRVGDDESR